MPARGGRGADGGRNGGGDGGKPCFEFAQTVSVHHTLGERETLTYEGGVIGVSQPTQRVESYYAQTVYRKAVYEDWLVMELVPQLVMERDEDWDPDPRFQFNLQVYFFDF